MQLNPYLFFNGQCEAAFKFYEHCLGGKIEAMMTHAGTPAEEHVPPEWRDKIPGIVHVDGSARPQTIERATNPIYYDLIAGFERETGIPVLVNTSFNVHEEPIVNTPRECAQALLDRRIDFVVTKEAIYEAAGDAHRGTEDHRRASA